MNRRTYIYIHIFIYIIYIYNYKYILVIYIYIIYIYMRLIRNKLKDIMHHPNKTKQEKKYNIYIYI